MAVDGLVDTVAYCGLICDLCRNATHGCCAGCRRGGGAGDCHQRDCCVDNGLDGCWECPSFPCAEGFFAEDAWKGLCIGSVQCIKENGIAGFVGRVASRLGESVDYGDYRFKNGHEIRVLLFGDLGKQRAPQASNPAREPDHQEWEPSTGGSDADS